MKNTYSSNSGFIISTPYRNDEITFNSTQSTNQYSVGGFTWQTATDLFHISNTATGDIGSCTKKLRCNTFNINNIPDDAIIDGISVELDAQRNGRVADYQVQLFNNFTPIGENYANFETDVNGRLILTNETVYGSETDLWGCEDLLTVDYLKNPGFGVVLQFQNHPYYPHRSSFMLYALKLNVYFH